MSGGNDPAGFAQSNIMILAEDTAQIASGEKDGAGAGSAGDAWFFPIMQGGSGSHEVGRLSAIPGLPREAVCMADSGTENTVGQDLPEPCGIGGKLTFGNGFYAVGYRNMG